MSLIVGVPVLFSGGGDDSSTTIAAIETTSTTGAEDTEGSLLDDVDVTAAFGAGANLLADDLVDAVEQTPTSAAATLRAELAAPASASAATGEATAVAPGSAAEQDPDESSASTGSTEVVTTEAPPTTAAPTTEAPPTTAVPVTEAPTTAVPVTEAPTTAPPATEAPVTEAAPAETAPAETAPVEAAPAQPTAEQWAALRACESGGNYTIVSSNGLYHGAYQFGVATWDNTARAAGRTDLVGVLPSQASAADQDALAVSLWSMRGNAPWPHCGMHIPDNV